MGVKSAGRAISIGKGATGNDIELWLELFRWSLRLAFCGALVSTGLSISQICDSRQVEWLLNCKDTLPPRIILI